MLKRQTLLGLLVLGIVCVGTGIAAFSRHRTLAPSGPPGALALQDLSLGLPGLTGPPHPSRHQRWERITAPSTLGVLLVASEATERRPLPEACMEWFAMPAYGPGPLSYEAQGSSWFFREIPLFGQGAYALQKQGKRLRLIACFSRGDRFYWVQLDTHQGVPAVQRTFSQLLLSLRFADGSSPSPTLAAALDGIPAQSGLRFFPPTDLPFLLPIPVLLLVFGIQLLVRWRSGRLPEFQANYREAGVEMALSGPMKLQYMDCAIGVSEQAITIYTFGTPFLVIPRRALVGRVSSGQDWLGTPYVLLEPEGPLDYRKYAWMYRSRRGTKLKLFTPEATRLALALMG